MRTLLAFILLCSSVNAATTGTLLIRGNIPASLSLTIDSNSNSLNLPLTSPQTDLLIGTATERSNYQAGYTISISSANNGSLKRQGGNEVLPYTIKYGNSSSLNLNTVQQVVYSNIQVHNTEKDIKISYPAASSTQISGDYEDTLTFTITVNN